MRAASSRPEVDRCMRLSQDQTRSDDCTCAKSGAASLTTYTCSFQTGSKVYPCRGTKQPEPAMRRCVRLYQTVADLKCLVDASDSLETGRWAMTGALLYRVNSIRGCVCVCGGGGGGGGGG